MFNKIYRFKTGLVGLLSLALLAFSSCTATDDTDSEEQQRTSDGNLVVSFGGTVLYNNQILDLGVSLVNMPTELIFDVKNIGENTINLTGNPTVRITNNSELYQGFQVSQELPKSLAPEASAQFIILYNPTMAGSSDCTIDIYTDETGAHHLGIGLHATARLHAPEIAVSLIEQVLGDNTDNSTIELANGATQRLSAVETGSFIDLTFAITNNGTSELTLGDDQETIALGTNSAYLLVSDAATDKLAPNQETEFTVRFAPKTVGSHGTKITIENNDQENSPFTISLMGSSYAGEIKELPEISVSVNGYNVVDGTSGLLLGSQLLGSSMKISVGIKNEGTANLSLGNSSYAPLSLLHNDSGCFAIKSQPKENPLAPYHETFGIITFTPTTVGQCCAKVYIPNSDDDEGSFAFTMCGEGYEKSTAAEITGYTVELHQNVGKESHKYISYTFASDLTMGSYIVFAREAIDLASWATLFEPALTAEQLEKVTVYWQTSDPETGDVWQSNGNDDVVIIKDPKGNIIDKSAVSENAIKIRDFATIENETLDAATEFDGNEGHYVLGLTTQGASGAPDPLTNENGQGRFTEPIYIYEIGERGKNNSLGGTTQLTNTKGNYVIFYLPENK